MGYTPEQINIVVDTISKAIIALGALYAVYEFFLFRKSKSITEESIETTVFKKEDKLILDIKVNISNKSRRRKYIKSLLIGIKGYEDDDGNQSVADGKMLRFSKELIIKKENDILKEYSRAKPNIAFWIDAGITQTFHYPITIENKYEFIQINGEYETGRTGNKYFSKIIAVE